MSYTFDTIIDRTNTDAFKLEKCLHYFGTTDLLPLWVADMDFATPPPIVEDLDNYLKNNILGYTLIGNSYNQSIIDWYNTQYNWTLQKEWLQYLNGVVSGLTVAIVAFTQPGDSIIIQTPVYYPFMWEIKDNQRIIANNQLIFENNSYRVDFDDLEAKAASGAKLLFLCSPHNPGGVVWDKETLQKIGEICSKHGVIVISDEIHADLTFSGNAHVPFATVSEQAANNSVTLVAPSKTFNIAGLATSTAIVINPELRRKYFETVNKMHISQGNSLSYIASISAYTKCDAWRQQLLKYLQENIHYVVNFLHDNQINITPMIPQASFLIWLDCRALGMTEAELKQFFVEKAKLGLNWGSMYGEGGEGFMRINIGTPRAVLEQAMHQLKSAIHNLSK